MNGAEQKQGRQSEFSNKLNELSNRLMQAIRAGEKLSVLMVLAEVVRLNKQLGDAKDDPNLTQRINLILTLGNQFLTDEAEAETLTSLMSKTNVPEVALSGDARELSLPQANINKAKQEDERSGETLTLGAVLMRIDKILSHLSSSYIDPIVAENAYQQLMAELLDSNILDDNRLQIRLKDFQLQLQISKFAVGYIDKSAAIRFLKTYEAELSLNPTLNDDIIQNKIEKLRALIRQTTADELNDPLRILNRKEIAARLEPWKQDASQHPDILTRPAKVAQKVLAELLKNQVMDPRKISVQGQSVLTYLINAEAEAIEYITELTQDDDEENKEKGRILTRLYLDAITMAKVELNNQLRKAKENEVAEFAKTAEKIPEILSLRSAIGASISDAELVNAVALFRQLLSEARAAINQTFVNINPEQAQYAEEHYWAPAQHVIDTLEARQVKLAEKMELEDKNREFDRQVAFLTQLIEAGELIKREDQQRSADLLQLRDNLIQARRLLDNNDFRSTYSNKSSEIDSLSRRSTALANELVDLIDHFENAELAYMPLEELARLTKATDSDPFLFESIREGGADRRKFEIAKMAQRRLFNRNPEHTSQQDFDRLRWKVWLQMAFLDAKLQSETEVASTAKNTGANANGIDGILERQMRERIVARKELILVLAQNPIWGQEFVQLRDAARIYAGLKPRDPEMADKDLPSKRQVERYLRRKRLEREPIMSKEGQIVMVNGRIYAYNYGASYASLTDETSGRANLLRLMQNFNIADPYTGQLRQANKEAIEFASLAFTTFTLLDDSYQELQASTMTRAHNPKEVDIGLLHKGVTAAVHRDMRYKKPADSSKIFWYLVDRSHIPEYFFRSPEAKHLFLHRVELFAEYQRCFFPTEYFDGTLPMPRFLEHVFPTANAFTELSPGERVWVPNPNPGFDGYMLVDHRQRHLLYKGRDGRVYNPQMQLLGRIDEGSSPNAGADTELAGGKFFSNGSNRGINLNNAKVDVTLHDGTTMRVGLNEQVTSRELYYNAMDGFANVIRIAFGKLPKKLTRKQILEAKEPNKSSVLNEMLAELGRAKMMPGAHIDQYTRPLLNWFVFRLLNAFESTIPQSRRQLTADLITVLSQASTYGGLSYDNIRTQVDAVIASLVTTKNKSNEKYRNVPIVIWEKDGKKTHTVIGHLSDAARPNEQYRRKEIIEFMKKWFEHEYPYLEIPVALQSRSLQDIAERLYRFDTTVVRAEAENSEVEEFFHVVGDHRAFASHDFSPIERGTAIEIADKATGGKGSSSH